MNAISKAIGIFGSQSSLANAIGTSQTAVSLFLQGRKRPSAETAMRIEAATKGAIKAEEIRPDVPWHIIRANEGRAA